MYQVAHDKPPIKPRSKPYNARLPWRCREATGGLYGLVEATETRLYTVTRQHSEQVYSKRIRSYEAYKTTLYQKYGRLGGIVEVMINHEERRIDV